MNTYRYTWGDETGTIVNNDDGTVSWTPDASTEPCPTCGQDTKPENRPYTTLGGRALDISVEEFIEYMRRSRNAKLTVEPVKENAQ